MKTNILRPLFDAGKLWQGDTKTRFEVTDSGFIELNQALKGHGWPAHMLSEILTEEFDTIPIQCALAPWNMQLDTRWFALVNPPYKPCAERLMQENIKPEKLDVIQTSKQDMPWCLEQLARASSTKSILAWEQDTLTQTQLRRLQLGCQQGETQLFFVRNIKHRTQASPAPTRAVISKVIKGFEISIFKQPGTNSRPPVFVSSDTCWLSQTPPAQRRITMTYQSTDAH